MHHNDDIIQAMPSAADMRREVSAIENAFIRLNPATVQPHIDLLAMSENNPDAFIRWRSLRRVLRWVGMVEAVDAACLDSDVETAEIQ